MRVLFDKGSQNKFLNRILSRVSVKEAAKLCKVSERTIKDWRRGKFLMPLSALRKLCNRTNTTFPKNIKLKDDYWYTRKGSSAGGTAVYKKYGQVGGDPEYRNKQWQEWWKAEGKYKKHPIINVSRPIKKPNYSVELAEFVGIILGDGGISRYQITITLHDKNDEEYGKFVTILIKNLFNVPVGIYHIKNCAAKNYIISRKALVQFCATKLGLKQGNKIKNQVDIPDWIKRSKQYSIACVRGLIDTDGSIFLHRYVVNGKLYGYKKISFTSHSEPLRQSVFNILRENGLNPRLTRKWDLCIDSIEKVKRYFEIIGSSNPGHLKKYKKKIILKNKSGGVG